MNKLIATGVLLAATLGATAANTLTYNLSGPKVTSFKLTDAEVGDEVKVATLVPSAYSNAYAGADISKVEFLTGTNFDANTSIYSNVRYKEVTLFISSNLQSAPVYTQTVEINQQQYAVNNVTLDTPYRIKAGEALWVGYSLKIVNDDDFYMPSDGKTSSPSTSSYTTIIKPGQTGDPQWVSRASSQGALCITLELTGSLPQGAAVVNSYDVPTAFNTEDTNSVTVNITNTGASPATEMTFDYTIGGVNGTSTGKILDSETLQPRAIAPFESGTVIIEGIRPAADGLSTMLVFTGKKVNGLDNPFASQAAGYSTFPCYDFSKGFDRIPVLEEGTSIGCQWCPAGHALGEYLHETYGDKFLMVAYHNDFSSTRDPMKSASGMEFMDYYVKGMPYGIYNRRTVSRLGYEGQLSSLAAIAGRIYDQAEKQRSFADLDLKAEFVYDAAQVDENEEGDNTPTPTGIAVNADVKFLFDVPESANNPFMLTFIIVEDDLGPYRQINAYAGSGDHYSMGGWEDLGARVSMKFNNVVRELYGFPGIEGSLPVAMEAGKTYSYSRTLEMGRAKGIKTSVVALLTNSVTREVVNARRFYLYEREEPGDAIETVNAAESVIDGPVVWYTLQGVRVDNPSVPGIYIKVQGNTVAKVLMK